jgi:putative Holliday junction resolvase
VPVFKTGALDHSATSPYIQDNTLFIRYAQRVKYIGVDYGTKRIGIAVSDDTGKLAFPLTTLEAGPSALAKIVELIKEKEAEKVILGESKNFKNEPNLVMEDIEQFKKDLAEMCGIQVEYEPEFFSSAAAAHQFAPDGSRKQNPSQDKLDAAAAALILQSYLDRNRKVE